MKKVWIVCIECQYAKEVFENEVYDYDECPLCRGRMVVDLNQGRKIEEPTGDNFPTIPNPPKEEKKSPTDTERLMINALAQEIKDFGEEYVFDNLNLFPIEKRLDYIEMFISAKRLLEKGEY